MLTEICNFVHNYFEHETYEGTFQISDGTIAGMAGILYDGQRFRIQGSARNNGIFTYHVDGIKNDDDSEADDLLEETFTGSIIAMAVPRDVLKLSAEIAAWIESNQAALQSPYTSESFGGYSYTKATGAGSNAGGVIGWQDMFKSRLNAYRKIA